MTNGENSFVEQRTGMISQAYTELAQQLTAQQLDTVTLIAEMQQQIAPIFNALFLNPQSNYHDFNYHGSPEAEVAIAEYLQRLETFDQASALALVNILLEEDPQANANTIRQRLYQRLGLHGTTLPQHSQLFQRRLAELNPQASPISRNEGATQEDVFEILRARVTELETFFNGSMDEQIQRQFVTEMRSNRPLRVAAMLYQQQNAERLQPPTDSLERLERLRAVFAEWGMISPGSSYIAGIETRADIVSDRNDMPRRLNALLDRLPEVPVLIPFIVENRYRIRQNTQRITSASPSRGGTDREGFEKFVEHVLLGNDGVDIFPSYFLKYVEPAYTSTEEVD